MGNWLAVSSSSAHPPSVLLEMSGSLCNEKFSAGAGATSQSVLLGSPRIMSILPLTQEEHVFFPHVPYVKYIFSCSPAVQ